MDPATRTGEETAANGPGGFVKKEIPATDDEIQEQLEARGTGCIYEVPPATKSPSFAAAKSPSFAAGSETQDAGLAEGEGSAP